jgi:hypothetical protein
MNKTMGFWNGWTGLENNATKEIENYSDLSIMFICGDWNAFTNVQTQSVTCHKTCRICGVIMLQLYCAIVKKQIIFSRSCLILVLTTVMGRPGHADVKNDV